MNVKHIPLYAALVALTSVAAPTPEKNNALANAFAEALEATAASNRATEAANAVVEEKDEVVTPVKAVEPAPEAPAEEKPAEVKTEAPAKETVEVVKEALDEPVAEVKPVSVPAPVAAAEPTAEAAPEPTPTTVTVEPAPVADPEPTPTSDASEPVSESAPEPTANEEAEAESEEDEAEATPDDTGKSAATFDEVEFVEDSALAARQPTVKGELTNGTDSLVDIECDEATLADVLRQFRKATGANIISGDSTNLQKRVSVSLKGVPWLQGMTAILQSRGFRIDERDNIYRVVQDVQEIPVSTRTFTLNHASSKELANLFNTTYGKKDAKGVVTQPIATSFEGANVVVVTATDKVISDCDAIIRAVDKAVAQIYIEARFMELSTSALHKLGVQWDTLESWGVSVNNIGGGMEYNNGRVGRYANGSTTTYYTPSGDNASGASAVDYTTKNFLSPGSVGAAAGAGRTAENMGWRNARGFSGQLSVSDFNLLMSAFEKMNDGKIFSNPKVIVSNGKEAKVDMTTKYPNVELTSQRNNSTTTSYVDFSAKLQQIPGDKETGLFAGDAFFSWGITLSVKPRISPDGLISVEIEPAISQLDTDVTADGFYAIEGGSDTGYGRYPIINMKSIQTDFTMKDGSTAVIGGLSRTAEEDVDSGIPYLRDIPWIGQKLFGWKSRVKTQKEIVVFVTVGIARPEALPIDLGLPKNAILGREYVRGNKLEPGDRERGAVDALTLDKRRLDQRDDLSAKKPARKGSVTITPAASRRPANIPAEAVTVEAKPATPAAEVDDIGVIVEE